MFLPVSPTLTFPRHILDDCAAKKRVRRSEIGDDRVQSDQSKEGSITHCPRLQSIKLQLSSLEQLRASSRICARLSPVLLVSQLWSRTAEYKMLPCEYGFTIRYCSMHSYHIRGSGFKVLKTWRKQISPGEKAKWIRHFLSLSAAPGCPPPPSRLNNMEVLMLLWRCLCREPPAALCTCETQTLQKLCRQFSRFLPGGHVWKRSCMCVYETRWEDDHGGSPLGRGFAAV